MNIVKDWIKESIEIWISKNSNANGSILFELIKYIQNNNLLRDAQKQAFLSYLWLKIEGDNLPIYDLICAKYPGGINKFKQSLVKEYKTLQRLLDNDIDDDFVKFYLGNKKYTDYVFSLPMGAGKTFVMAGIIYLELYLSSIFPNDIRFAKNFLILAPSGLKNSVIPSLKSIENFDPSWVLPKLIAENIQKTLAFQLLDQPKSDKKSNRANNPNAQKVNSHLVNGNLSGLIMVTNAEKVILDKISDDPNANTLFEQTDDQKAQIANELRHTIAKIPNLMILIDEVHHTQKEENKLLNAISIINEKGNVKNIYGFTGTPYSDKIIETTIDNIQFKTKITQITNTISHYPIKNAIGNFLKTPIVYGLAANSDTIIKQGLQNFWDKLWEYKYTDGRLPKLAIYCSNISRLKNEVAPIIKEFLTQKSISFDESVLEYYGEKNGFKLSPNAQFNFENLDKSQSIRIVLLCQIGKEGWDCPSLTSVILSNEGDSPKNMVLQTTCRCLREVVDAKNEFGYIYLNSQNYNYLDEELQKSHGISIKELTKDKTNQSKLTYKSRIEHLELPKILYNQLHVSIDFDEQNMEYSDSLTELKEILGLLRIKDKKYYSISSNITRVGLDGDNKADVMIDTGTNNRGNKVMHNDWVSSLQKSFFGRISFDSKIREVLNKIYLQITNDSHWIQEFDLHKINNDILKVFLPKPAVNITEKVEERNINWLITDVENKEVSDKNLYPHTKEERDRVLELDENGQSGELSESEKLEKQQKYIQLKKDFGELANSLIEKDQRASNSLITINKEKTLHYLPYQFDSNKGEGQKLNELSFFESVLQQREFKANNLEIYFNGNRHISNFKITIYKKFNDKWILAQQNYTPDYLIIKRNQKSKIDKILIVEIKGGVFAGDYENTKTYMEGRFIEDNPNYQYLYLEDSDTLERSLFKLNNKIQEYFGE
jgi:type III restriction enzyme